MSPMSHQENSDTPPPESDEARDGLFGATSLFEKVLPVWEYCTARLVFERLAQEIHTEATFTFGAMYDFGVGVAEDDQVDCGFVGPDAETAVS